MEDIVPFKMIWGGYDRIYNLALASRIGVCPSILIANLLDIEKKCKKFINDKKHGDGWFPATIDTIQQLTALTREEQTNSINKLIRLHVIDVEVFGLPAVRCFRIYPDKLEEIIGFRVTYTKGIEDVR